MPPGPNPCGFCGLSRWYLSSRRPCIPWHRAPGGSRPWTWLARAGPYVGPLTWRQLPRGVASSRRTVSSFLSQYPRNDCRRFPSVLSAQTSFRAWSPLGRLASRRAKRRRRLSNCAESRFRLYRSVTSLQSRRYVPGILVPLTPERLYVTMAQVDTAFRSRWAKS